MDWVGVLIERVSGVSLDEYFQKNVLQPLSIQNVSFFPSEEAMSNLAFLHRRAADGSLSHVDHLYRAPLSQHREGSEKERFCAGGHGCFGRPAELSSESQRSIETETYRILISCPGLIAVLLNDGVDAASGIRLLKKETVDGKTLTFRYHKRTARLIRSNRNVQRSDPWHSPLQQRERARGQTASRQSNSSFPNARLAHGRLGVGLLYQPLSHRDRPPCWRGILGRTDKSLLVCGSGEQSRRHHCIADSPLRR